MIDLSSLSGHCLSGLLDVSVKTLALALLASVWLGMGWARSPVLRHAVWATVLCGMLGLPLLSLATPEFVLPVLPSSPGRATAAEATLPMALERTRTGAALPAEAGEVAAARQKPLPQTDLSPRSIEASSYRPAHRVTWTLFAFCGYLGGVFVLLVRLVLGLAVCRWIVQGSRAIAVQELTAGCSPSLVHGLLRYRVEVRVCSKVRVPMTLGWWHAKILLPPDWQAWGSAKREAVLAHELAHVERRDALFVLLGAINQCLYWFHPLAWLVPRRLASLSERVCDDRAIALTGAPVLYARCLLEFAATNVDRRGRVALGTLTMANTGDLGRRIEAVLDRRRAISPPLTRQALLLLMTLAVLIVPTLAALRVGPRALGGAVHPRGTPAGPSANAGDQFEYAGRVLDPDGKPFSGASIRLAYIRHHGQSPPPVRATSDSEGRFRFTVTTVDFANTDDLEPWTTAEVVATADGFGLSWARAYEIEGATDDRRNLTIRLARDDVQIEGRLLDSRGRPVGGATIRLKDIRETDGGDMSAWLAGATTGAERLRPSRWLWAGFAGLPQLLTTDALGRFSIAGVGRERAIRLIVSGSTIQTSTINVLTRVVNPFHLNAAPGSPNWGTYYGAHFDHVALPTQPVVGVVTDRDTGAPLAGVRIACRQTAFSSEPSLHDIEAITGKDGRYRLVGMPRGPGNEILVLPGPAGPYLRSAIKVPERPLLETVTLDIALKRGVMIEGQVADRTTGSPVQADVFYKPFRDNPHLARAPGFEVPVPEYIDRVRTGPDGTYQIAGLPGRGLVSGIYLGKGDLYWLKDDREFKRISSQVISSVSLERYTILAEIAVPDKALTYHSDLLLERGITRTVRVVDPEGNAISDASLWGYPYRGTSVPERPGEYRISGLRSKQTIGMDAVHEGRKLAGSFTIDSDREEITEVKLSPIASVIGRVVGEDGQPRVNLHVALHQSLMKSGVTDSQGRFRVEGLTPGRPMIAAIYRDQRYLGRIELLTLKPGEVRDLGDVKARNR